MTLYETLPLLQGLFPTVLFLLVARSHWRSPTNRWFLSFLAAMALWGFSVGLMRTSSNLGYALWWERVTLVAIGFTSGSFFFFARRYTGLGYRVGGPLGLFFLPATVTLALTPFLVKGMSVDAFGNAPVWGLAFPVWVVWNYAFVIAAMLRLEHARQASTSYEVRNRYLYFILGAVLSLIGAGTDAISAAGAAIYPLAVPANIAFSCLTTIAVLKYHLLDIRLTARQGMVYLFTSALVALPLFAVPALLVWLAHGSGLSGWWLATPVFVSALFVEPLWKRALRRVQRWFYGERYDHLRALERFSELSKGVTGMEELCSLTVSWADRTLQPASVWLLVASAEGDFSVAASLGKDKSAPIKVGADNPLAMRLEQTAALVWQRELDVLPQLQAMRPGERAGLDLLQAELYGPIVTGEQLIGIVALGPKRSGQPYSREDLQMLSTLCRQACLNLENVRLLRLERQRAFNLQKMEQMKSDFLLSVSHQLKTPLTSVKVSAGILADTEAQIREDLHDKLVSEINQGVGELETQISMILDLAKMQNDILELKPQPTDVKQVVHGVVSMLGPQIRLKEQAVNLDLGEAPLNAVIDRQRFSQILTNLLSNANKFTPRGGRISVRLWEDGASFFVDVNDTGPGIPPEERQKIFQPFYQSPRSGADDTNGTGLGLAIARGLAELHGGRIWVGSEASQGATFLVCLPLAARATPSPAATPSQDIRPGDSQPPLNTAPTAPSVHSE